MKTLRLVLGDQLSCSISALRDGANIDRMSDYCNGCAYDPKIKLGTKACPFNYLYWYFLIVNETRLKHNPRMGMPYRTLARMADERR